MDQAAPQGYRAVKAEILKRIRARRWPPGHAIPGEVALAEEFGCARATVNRAMRELSEEGIIDRKRKTGSRVASAPVRLARLEIPLIRAEIEAAGGIYRYELLSREERKTPDWLKARLALSMGTAVLHLRCLHLSGNAPFVFEDRWINLAAVPRARVADFKTHNPNEWLVAAVPFSEAEFAFSAAAAERAVADLLGIPEGAALFIAERTTWLGGKPITFARMNFPPGYRMVTRL